ncbi:putative Diguanylate cyclase [Pseudodesulfovibrio piezophilus C1TLV30]|uniref:Putative Diguanylate cyclase n=2 Tax=Pseudodesulfovibrio TaxID=2035811 RepID=M1WLX4_PSEP2|nr:putative Diguanylate cyclase [Pseudodesulfovibrio piezophilus C1TLV30]
MRLEDIPGGLIILFLSGKIAVCNQAGATLLGRSQEELSGMGLDELFLQAEDFPPLLEELSKGKSLEDREVCFQHTEKSEHWLRLNARPGVYEGEAAALLSIFDISSHKKTHEQLQLTREELRQTLRHHAIDLEQSREAVQALDCELSQKNCELDKATREKEGKFRALFNNSHAVMLLLDAETGEIKDANPAASEYYGYSLDELTTMTIAEINSLSPEEFREEKERAEKRQHHNSFFSHKLASGEIRRVEVFSGPVEYGETSLTYSIVHDITDRRQAEEQLLRFKRIIASTPDLIALVDRQYYNRLANDSYLKALGKPIEQVVDKPMEDVLGTDYFKNELKPYLDKAFNGEVVQKESVITTHVNTRMHLSITYHPVCNANGSIDFVSITASNITERKRHEEKLKIFSERLALATDAGKIGIWEWNAQDGSILWDKMMMHLYQTDKKKFAGTFDSWMGYIGKEDVEPLRKQLMECFEKETPFDAEFRIVWPDGEIRHVKAAALVKTQSGMSKRMIGVNWDVTTKRRLEEKLRHIATTDSLTGANNRRSFMERAHEEIARSKRYGTPLALLSLDIDLFKRVNDTYGHPVGDMVLRSLVKVCRETLRETDIFSRMGGEEFSAILPETDLDSARATAERLREAVEADMVHAGADTVRYTISIGVSILQGEKDLLDRLMRRADKALYRAKEFGRNRVEEE